MPRIVHGLPVALEAVNQTLETAHDLNAALNLPFALLAVAPTPPFDYMFGELQTQADALLPETDPQKTVADLKKLGAAMNTDGDASARDSALPAAYTYFGQFLDHEITLTLEAREGAIKPLNNSTLAPLPLGEAPQLLANGRSSRLDLDCVYGALPNGNAEFRDGDKLRLSVVSPSGDRPPGKDDFNDLPRRPRSDNDPRTDREAIIGDARNDENLIIAQLHVAFLRAHNALIARGHSFTEASLSLRQHFQWLVIHDFLMRVASPEIVNEILTRGENRFYKPSADAVFMPLEFSVAAYRFGHSLVRNTYRFNRNFTNATLLELFTLTAFSGNLNPIPGEGFPTLPENWIIEWEEFLDGGANSARRIDTYLTEPLSAIRGITGEPLPDEARLAVRNLLRGYLLRIPTGQAVARAMGREPLTSAQIKQAAGQAQAQVLEETGFLARTPLWYYILAEAASHLPDHLGPVGSTIVAEVLIELVRQSEDSILRQANWRPTLGAQPGRFTLRDLLQLAGVLNPPESPADEVRQISQSKLQGEESMPMSIIDKVEIFKGKLLLHEQDPANPEAIDPEDNMRLAVAAIQAGIHSTAWETYMEQFAAGNPQHLMRLKATDGTLGDLDMDRRRAYLVSGAVCGTTTTDKFGFTVPTIDNGL